MCLLLISEERDRGATPAASSPAWPWGKTAETNRAPEQLAAERVGEAEKELGRLLSLVREAALLHPHLPAPSELYGS